MANWYDCQIIVAGASADQGGVTDVQVTSSDGKLVNRNLRADPSVRKEILAVALAALSTGRRVAAFIDDGVAPPAAAPLLALQLKSG